MSNTRRDFIKKSVTVSSVAMLSGLAITQEANAAGLSELFTKKTAEQALKENLNIKEISLSDKINLKIPTIAENGAVVPLTVSSELENVQQVIIVVEKNPVPIVAVFELSPDVETFVSARVKMAETSKVVAILKAEGLFYKTEQLVKVTIGGCGG